MSMTKAVDQKQQPGTNIVFHLYFTKKYINAILHVYTGLAYYALL